MNIRFAYCATFLLAVACGSALAQDTPLTRAGSSKDVDPLVIANEAKYDAAGTESNRIVRLAAAALKKGDVRKGTSLLTQALSVFPDNCEARVRFADFHLRSKQPEAAVADLKPIVEPSSTRTFSVGSEPAVRMLYVLALLDSYKWEAAAACYNASIKSNLAWSVPGGGPSHLFPNVRFTLENPDIAGLRAQAHLILGGLPPSYGEQQDAPVQMLEHVREVLRIFPGSLDGRFLTALLLAKMDRFNEARAAFDRASLNASRATKDEIAVSCTEMERREERHKL